MPTMDSVADVAEMLMGEYGQHVSLSTVSDVVLAVHRDLVGRIPTQTTDPEELYRLARTRLGAHG